MKTTGEFKKEGEGSGRRGVTLWKIWEREAERERRRERERERRVLIFRGISMGPVSCNCYYHYYCCFSLLSLLPPLL